MALIEVKNVSKDILFVSATKALKGESVIVTDLSNSFNPVPKNERIKNKKLLQDKKRNM